MLTEHKTAIKINSEGEVGIKGSDDLSTFISFRLSNGATICVSKKKKLQYKNIKIIYMYVFYDTDIPTKSKGSRAAAKDFQCDGNDFSTSFRDSRKDIAS